MKRESFLWWIHGLSLLWKYVMSFTNMSGEEVWVFESNQSDWTNYHRAGTLPYVYVKVEDCDWIKHCSIGGKYFWFANVPVSSNIQDDRLPHIVQFRVYLNK